MHIKVRFSKFLICFLFKNVSSATPEHNTIHYLSPATTDRTQYEGDDNFDYKLFAPYPRNSTESDFLSTETIPCEEPLLQRTIAIIKPEAMIFQDVVLKIIRNSGFTILNVN